MVRIAAAVLMGGALSTAGAATGAQGAAAAVGYVRLAHLSPDTPEVDVYLSSQSGAVQEKIFPGVGYGVMSPYMSLPAGGYAVAMRLAGAAPSAPAVLTTQVSLSNGSAVTVAGVGRYAGLGLKVLTDDLALPQGDKAKVRIVQASVRAPILGVSVANGPVIADNVAFATTTDYQLVDPGRWRLQVRPTGGGASTELSSTLGAGSVYSLLILDGKSSGLTTELRIDASRKGEVPDGGVQTGGGGLRLMPMLWLAGGLLIVALMGAAVLIWRVRRP